jgi:hypothetical protein
MCDQIHVPAALIPMEIPVSTEYKAKWVSDQDLKVLEKRIILPLPRIEPRLFRRFALT